LALPLAACTPKIGDKCILSTDCSTQGSRQCDTSMPGGYCTVYNCGPNSCPDYAACYLFHPEVQGCTYNDRDPSRTGKSFCMAGCQSTSDCRQSYECVDARLPPWNALLLDDNQNQKVCVPYDDTALLDTEEGGLADGQAPVCQAYPDVDAAFPASVFVDSSVDDAAGASDAGVDATLTSGAGDAAPE